MSLRGQERVTGSVDMYANVTVLVSFVNLAQVGVIWAEGTSNDKMLPSYYPVRCSMEAFSC